MTYILLIRAEDGTHSHVYPSQEEAEKGLIDQMGYAPERIVGRHVDDWGRVLIIETRPDNWTEDREELLGRAYDRRECGLPLSQAQTDILKEFEA
jgi:hypothetical protein